MRGSTGIGVVPATGRTHLSSMTRSSLTWSGSGISPISSRNRVPWLAATNSPWLACTAVVNAPRTWPKSWLSSSASGIAPQLIATKAASWRGPPAGATAANRDLPPPPSAADQHVARRAGGQGDLLVQRPDGVALADERVGRPWLHGALHQPVLPERFSILQQALHPLLQEVDREGLLEVVAGAPAERG